MERSLFGGSTRIERSAADVKRDQDARRTRDVNESAHPNKITVHDLTSGKS